MQVEEAPPENQRSVACGRVGTPGQVCGFAQVTLVKTAPECHDPRVKPVSVGLVSVVAGESSIPRLARGGLADQIQHSA